MSELTQRLVPEGGAVAKRLATARPAAPPSPDPLAHTLVSDRVPIQVPVVPPVVFPGYEILGEVGRGGMGVVYKARQRNLNRLVALKVILGGPLASEEDKARFRLEAEAAARLQHPNIVQVYDVGEHDGFSYMALELIEGDTLRRWQNGQPIDPRQAAKLMSAVARALHHAHEQGIVHRDIKPANILLAPVPAAHPDPGAPRSAAVPAPLAPAVSARVSSGGAAVPLAVAPKVTDFGLAKALDGGHDLTVTGVACGTPNYMAPEQVRGRGVSPRADVYGLGAVLFELLAGRPPFGGSDPAAVLHQILKAEPPGVRKFAPAVPRDLAVIVAKCLEKNPGTRYGSARDAADDLDRFLANKPIAARPVGPAGRLWRWAKRNPVATAFLVVSTLGCGVTGGLAVALARAAGHERQARASAEGAREETDEQRRAAEYARDRLRTALAATEAARQQADRARAVADREKDAADAAREVSKHEARRAGEKQQEADDARARAEDNLRVARAVIRTGLRELSRHPRFEEEDFRAARMTFLEQGRAFRDTVVRHAPNTPEWLDDLSDVCHWLGFLEYLNNNQNEAAAEYARAAEAAGKWAALEPARYEPRARQSYSLVNAGNALVNAHRHAEAEACYREAVALIDAVAGERPRDAFVRAQAVEAHGQLANVFRLSIQPAAWEEGSRDYLDRARTLVRDCGATPEHRRLLALAYLSAARALAVKPRAAGEPAVPESGDEAEEYFAVSIALWDELRTGSPAVSRFAFDYGAALLAQAGYFNSRGAHERAGKGYHTAVAVLEKAQAAAAGVNSSDTDLVMGCVQYAEFLRARKEYPEAERRYDQAIDLANAVLRRVPTYRPAREVWVAAAVGRAHLYNVTTRHPEAAAEWAKLAAEDPDPRRRPRHELFVMQSLLFARDWKAARAEADARMKKDQPGWMWLEVARVWCLTAKQIDADAGLAPADKLAAAEQAIEKAVACLGKARDLGELAKPDIRKWYSSNADLAPARDRFEPDK